MYLVKTPQVLQKLFPQFTWRIPTNEKVLYLTFDDGPIPEVTPWVLDQLRQYHAKATFFCVGHNVDKHPDIFEAVRLAGHGLGSHTYHHLNGCMVENPLYLLNVRRGAQKVGTRLFRPPYGRLRRSQGQFLQRHYQIVMWDVLSGDFDRNLKPEACLKNVVRSVVPGSIVVFHDSIKASERLYYTLPRVLEHFSAMGYRFGNLEVESFQHAYSGLQTA